MRMRLSQPHCERTNLHRPTLRLPYWPGLDGLRALAVIAVLLYHANPDWLPGGFLGVEIFFVISGYLITSLLIAEWREQGSIDLKAFWLRRARRLLPAVCLMIALVLAWAVIFLPTEVAGLRSDALAAIGYVTNWYLIFSQKSYFESVGRPSLLRHLWSLAVEEQFYLLWPLLLISMLRVGHARSARRTLLVVLMGVVASTTLMGMLYQPDMDPSRVYYGTDTRSAGLLLGAALAFVWAPRQQQVSRGHRRLLDAIGLSGLGVLGWFCIRLNEFEPFLYRGGFLSVALVTMVVIAVAVHPQARLGMGLLGRQPLRWIGLRSYGIYLWHWPVLMVTRPQLDVLFDGLPLFALRLVITALLVELSYRFVEMPVRTGALGNAWKEWRAARETHRRGFRMRWATVVTSIGVLSVAFGASVAGAQPPVPPSYLSAVSVETAVSANPSIIIEVVSNAGESTLPVDNEQSKPDQPAAAPVMTTSLDELPVAQSPELLALPSPTAMAPVEVARSQSVRAAAKTNANLRTGPGALYGIVEVLESGQELDVVGKSPFGDWYKVSTAEGTAGWVWADLLSLDQETGDVPVAPMPPAPANPIATSPASKATPVPAGSPERATRITAIGDSVMLSAAGELKRALGDVEMDAALGRQSGTTVDLLRARRAAGQLGTLVIVHMGNNGVLSARQLDAMMEVLADVPKIVFVNVKVPRAWQSPNNVVLAEGASRYPNLVLVDWHTASVEHPEFFWSDGTHLRPEGARVYAELIAASVGVH